MSRSEVEREIQRQISLAREAEDGTWITYLMRDPRRPDLRGNVAGWPVYVGQTDDFANRVRNHLRKSEKLARKGSGIKYRLKSLLHAGVVPNFEVLDRQPTRLRSLLSETNYARLCRARGYDIANRTTLQNVAGPPVTMEDLPAKWFRSFTIEQAIADGLEVVTVCRECHEQVRVPATSFQSLPYKTLGEILKDDQLRSAPCSLCEATDSRRVLFRLSTPD